MQQKRQIHSELLCRAIDESVVIFTDEVTARQVNSCVVLPCKQDSSY